MSDDSVIDPLDGLPAMSVGPWAITEKHARLRRYVEITSAARKRFLPPKGTGGATYIDLYCGPGRVFDRDACTFHDGSSLVAWNAAAKTNSGFSEMFLGDIKPASCDATLARLRKRNAIAHAQTGSSLDTASWVVRNANPYGLHLAMLDPYSLGAMPFDVIRILSGLKRIDLVMHVSTSDLQRNLPRFLDSGGECELDQFAPGWRKKVKAHEKQVETRRRILEHWRGLIREQGLTDCHAIAHVQGGNQQTLYWLVHASRHSLAHRFWETAKESGPQRSLL